MQSKFCRPSHPHRWNPARSDPWLLDARPRLRVNVSAANCRAARRQPRRADMTSRAARRGAGWLGPNRAGKTTTCNAHRHLAPTPQHPDLPHRIVGRPTAARRHRFLTEVPPLYKELKVNEYLRFAAACLGFRERSPRTPLRASAALRIEELANAYRHLSKGYQHGSYRPGGDPRARC